MTCKCWFRKIVAHNPEFLGEANQALKHQFAQSLRDPYFGAVARGQCLSSPDSKSVTQFWGQLALMFNSRGKCTKVVNTTAAVENEDTDQQLSHNSRKRQYKINVQAAEITAVKAELNRSLQERKKIKRPIQSGKSGGDHDQSSQCHDCEGAPTKITGHSIHGIHL